MSSPASTAARVAVLLVTMAVGAACGSSGDRVQTVSPSASAAPSTTSTPTPNAAACGQVLAVGTEFAAALTGFAQGQATLDQLTTAANQLLNAVNAAVAAATDAYRDKLTELQGELQAMQSALQQTPPQPASIRAAGREVASTLATLVRPCVSATPTSS